MEFDPHTWEHEISEASSSRKDNAKSACNFLENQYHETKPKVSNSETHETSPTFHNPDNYYFADKIMRKRRSHQTFWILSLIRRYQHKPGPNYCAWTACRPYQINKPKTSNECHTLRWFPGFDKWRDVQSTSRKNLACDSNHKTKIEDMVKIGQGDLFFSLYFNYLDSAP